MNEAIKTADLGSGRADENFVLAIPAAASAAIVGALLWATFGYFTGMSLGLVAILIGALVGYAVRTIGKGGEPKFGYLGGAGAALGWALGTWMCDIALLAKETGRPIFDVLGNIGLAQSLIFAVRAADVMDVVFLGIAVWEGYRFSFRHRKVRGRPDEGASAA
jgi:hypothetical protein